ncbi:hypothetical protein BGZ70_002463 [Mortierella alpina]|uniref:Transmembrane protein n=1 Tax=Mortierella alpina TaxID=64518 RepID=A0A9P6JES7_MORAP|nr:hypothetical protein BGZ70_002463 [Mortierella alpina]
MPILRAIPLQQTLKRPVLDLTHSTAARRPQLSVTQQAEEAERGHAVPDNEQDNLGEYPVELFQLRLNALQEHLSEHHPTTLVYISSLFVVFVILVVFLVTMLALHVSDGKPWVLGVIVIMILLFISKMSFLSRIEKAHKTTTALLQSFNDQDMSRYGVLYRLRPRQPSSATEHSWIARFAHRLNLGLPCWAVDLTTIDHIDEHSFQDHPASDPHASPEEILARDNELPTYRPKADQDHELVLSTALPPKYDEVALDMDPMPTPASPASSAAPSAPPAPSHSVDPMDRSTSSSATPGHSQS